MYTFSWRVMKVNCTEDVHCYSAAEMKLDLFNILWATLS